MSGQKVNGNVVVVCLTLIVLASIGAVVWLSAVGKDAPIALAALVGLLGAAVPGVINTLQVNEVKHQTNGQHSRLVDLVETLSVPPQQGQERHPRAPGGSTHHPPEQPG